MPKHDHLHSLPITERYPIEVWRAINYAATAHETQTRKMSGNHYIEHPFGVFEIVRTVTSDEATQQAAVLHDTVEDTTVTFDDLARDFSPDVAGYVWGVSKDDTIDDWKERNQAYLRRLEDRASDSSVIIALADKIHNITDMIVSFDEYGDSMWDKFNANADDQLWWFSSVLALGRRRLPDCPLVDKLDQLVAVFEHDIVKPHHTPVSS